MRNLKGNSLRIGLLVILVSAVFAPTLVHAQDYTVGVKAGDWVKYGQIAVTWTGNGTAPSFVTDEMKADWFRIDISSVAGTTATLNDTVHYTNGTQTVQTFDADVQSGNATGYLFLVGSNLTAGDLFNPHTYGTINQTVTRMYAGADRTVNIIDYSTFKLGETKIIWDQKTGITVELYANLTFPAYPGGYMEESWKATETNLWSANALNLIQNNLIYIIPCIAIIIVIVAATIFVRRRKHPPVHEPPFPSAPPPPLSQNGNLLQREPNKIKHERHFVSITN